MEHLENLLDDQALLGQWLGRVAMVRAVRRLVQVACPVVRKDQGETAPRVSAAAPNALKIAPQATGGITMTQLDDTDREIISTLRADARTPVATLAHRLRVSRGTVQNRLRKMEESGVIVGYTVRLRPDSEPQRIRAWMSIAVEGNAAPEVIRALRGEPTVGTLHSTNGRWDIVAEVRADSLEAFDRALGRIRLTPGIANTETSILLSTFKA